MVYQSEAYDTDSPQGKKTMRKKFIKTMLLLVFIIIVMCFTAIFHKYGPYTGKVVDIESEKPIKGAAVLVVFRTESFYAVSSYADAVETVTDEKGEFKIPWQLAVTFHPLSSWKPYGYITIFKPGYGVYPGYDGISPMFVPNGTLPEKQYITFRLPKLDTVEERKKNLRCIWSSGSVPDRKARYLLKLADEEDGNVGIKN